ncbi:hypothetical protein [Bacillus sp. B1-b2]|uniref:hypothetical protein n=1 Tax=Bacillus sp. B1-b2 TaxID=2653201 RepID=UPI00186A1686|nr:hypothetical protein [Bacillus sp. B1-b2]
MKSKAFSYLNRKNPLISKEINSIFAFSRNSPLIVDGSCKLAVVFFKQNINKLIFYLDDLCFSGENPMESAKALYPADKGETSAKASSPMKRTKHL